MANKRYAKVFKEKIARLYLEEDRSLSSLSKDIMLRNLRLMDGLSVLKKSV